MEAFWQNKQQRIVSDSPSSFLNGIVLDATTLHNAMSTLSTGKIL